MLAAVPTSGDVPLLGRVRRALDPLLSWSPDWLEAVVWAAVVYVLGLAVLSTFAWYGVPWLARVSQRPATALLNGVGIVLLLPEYVMTTRRRRQGRRVPTVAFSYGDVVQIVVTATQRAARWALSSLDVLKDLPPMIPAVTMLVGLIVWNSSYCEGRGDDCRMPTTEWAASVWDWVTPDLGGSAGDDQPPPSQSPAQAPATASPSP